MDDTARDVCQIAGIQSKLQRWTAALMSGSVESLSTVRQFDWRSVDCPILGINNLQHKYVVRIVMRPGTLSSGWCHISVGLEGTTKFALEVTAKMTNHRNHSIQIG